MSLLDGIIHTMVMSLSKLWEIVRTGKSGVTVYGVAKSQTQY